MCQAQKQKLVHRCIHSLYDYSSSFVRADSPTVSTDYEALLQEETVHLQQHRQTRLVSLKGHLRWNAAQLQYQDSSPTSRFTTLFQGPYIAGHQPLLGRAYTDWVRAKERYISACHSVVSGPRWQSIEDPQTKWAGTPVGRAPHGRSTEDWT